MRGSLRWLGAALLLAALAAPGLALAQARTGPPPAPAAAAEREPGDQLVQLDFDDVELPVVIDTIARLTGRNFIYDDRVRGRVTIVSPTRITVDQAYAVFESVLQVKGFTTVAGPGGAIKIIPVRDAKQSSIPTTAGRRPAPRRDQFITRLIPLRYIDAEAITNTLKPLVSNDAAMVAYAPTNTVILTDASSNIRRILAILESIDVETYKEELAVLRLQHADASTLAQQLSEVFGGAVTSASAAPRRTVGRTRRPAAARAAQAAQASGRGQPRIITDERTNSLIVLASRSQLEDIRAFVETIDVPVEGGGRIQVYYLKHADAEELAQTLNALISGQPAPSPTAGPGGGAQPQALRAAVTELAGGATVTADAGTNSLVIQASPEGYASLVAVIEQLDIPRPQVLVEALIMEVDVTDSQDLGFNGVLRLVRGDNDITVSTLTDSATTGDSILGVAGGTIGGGFLGNFIRDTVERDTDGNIIGDGSIVQGLIRAAATDNNTNILSAPHILTSDNEEAEILVGDNIPIITSRVQQAVGGGDTVDPLATSVNVERQDIGVTLRVTPQITEGDSLRLKIFQEITAINTGLSVGDAEDVGVPLSNRRIDNTVVVKDNETVVVGGLISEDFNDTESKVPWLGDVPILGWLFKTNTRELTKKNLLVFLTPHIVRTPADLELQTVRKREEFRRRSEQSLGLYDPASDVERLAEAGIEETDLGLLAATPEDQNAPRAAISAHERRYPLARMREIEEQRARDREQLERSAPQALEPSRYEVLAGVYRDSAAAQEALARLLAAGYEGSLVSAESQGAVMLELRLGPYDSLEEAERAAHEVRERFEMTPRVLVEQEGP